jgi:hypothetical protein
MQTRVLFSCIFFGIIQVHGTDKQEIDPQEDWPALPCHLHVQKTQTEGDEDFSSSPPKNYTGRLGVWTSHLLWKKHGYIWPNSLLYETYARVVLKVINSPLETRLSSCFSAKCEKTALDCLQMNGVSAINDFHRWGQKWDPPLIKKLTQTVEASTDRLVEIFDVEPALTHRGSLIEIEKYLDDLQRRR